MKKLLYLTIFISVFLFFACEDNSSQGGNAKPEPPEKPIIEESNTYEISGRIIKAGSDPIQGRPNIIVYLIGTNSFDMRISDKEGNFSFDEIEEGEYVIQPSKDNYIFLPGELSTTVVAGDVMIEDIVSVQLNNGLIDEWGYIWDGTVRGPKNWQDANDLCKALNGRLPTPTEIYRNNSATGNGGIGDSSNTEYLWTIIPYDATQYVTEKINDGATSQAGSNTAQLFRCVWPNKKNKHFTGNSIYGPPGNEGFELDGGKYVMDKYDRPLLNHNSASRECNFYNAHLPSARAYTEAIQDGLPNGMDKWLFSSDQSTTDSYSSVKWLGTNADFHGDYSAQGIWQAATVKSHYRCIGINSEADVNPIELSDEYTDEKTLLKSTNNDVSVDDDAIPDAVDLSTAINYCYANGGHLPTTVDLMELIQTGLPNGNGPGSYLWTADYLDENFVGILKWVGIDLSYTGFYATYMTRSDYISTKLYNFRCVYYPIDETYNGPDPELCQGGPGIGCFESNIKVNGNKAKTWIDKFDRAPATFSKAVKDCYSIGGHLASHRDLAELIPQGLPYGSCSNPKTDSIWTSDYSNAEAETVCWSDTDLDFNGYWDDGSYETTRNAVNELPYRCMWTNELKMK